jgi:PRC-barrel domain
MRITPSRLSATLLMFATIAGPVLAASQDARVASVDERSYGLSNIALDSDNGALVPAAASTQVSVARSEAASASLDAVPNPAQTLKAAAVRSSDGKDSGKIAKVEVGADGRPKAVEVKVGGFFGLGGKIVSIDADALSYDAGKKIVVADLTADEIKALPETDGS